VALVSGKAGSLDRGEVTSAIALELGLEPPVVGTGSTVQTEFLDRVLEAMGLDPREHASSYRKLEEALDAVGEIYDTSNDSSEAHGRTGGGTITNAGYRKLLRGIRGEPRCFILNVADNPAGARYADVTGESYGFDTRVSGHAALNEAGPGSLVVFRRTGRASHEPRRTFFATAQVTSIQEGEQGTFRAQLSGHREFVHPVSDHDVALEGWNKQHGIVEIEHDALITFEHVGRGEPSGSAAVDGVGAESTVVDVDDTTPPRKGFSEEDADRLLELAGPVDAPLPANARADPIPDVLPKPSGPPLPERQPALPEEVAGRGSGGQGGSATRRRLDRYVEARAVHLAKEHLVAHGWRLQRDRQAQGIGYDLEFVKEDAVLHVEVKGIAGHLLAFNVTAFEWRRVLEDDRFIVVAVTDVLEPSSTQIHVLTRDKLHEAERNPVQYRLRVQ
jgi:hypothetical protein